jgi:hypothetical protein
MESQMVNTMQYRAKSSAYDELVKATDDPGQIRKYQDSKDSFSALAENQEWLANNADKTVHKAGAEQPSYAVLAAKEEPSHAALAAEEEHVLRCLGAAVIMQWNTISTKLQRELFDTAGSMGELLNTAELRGQIAKFLHKHKDDVPGA